MVAEGSPDVPLEDPGNLVAVGFISISDPLRPSVPAAVRRCRDAGVRLVMITGDHPATARAIARKPASSMRTGRSSRGANSPSCPTTSWTVGWNGRW